LLPLFAQTNLADHFSYREPYQRYVDAQIDVQDHQYGTTHDYDQQTTSVRDYYHAPPAREQVRVRTETRTTVDPPKEPKSDMGYYDDEGQHHSFRDGLHRAADRILHPIHGPRQHQHHQQHHQSEPVDDIIEERRTVNTMSAPRRSSSRSGSNTSVSIPCHHIRIGDLLYLQGRPCQVIRITTSSQTGQHRYLGVDLFTKQLQEESSFISNPSPSVVVQQMYGPVFKQYRVLDVRDDGHVVAMTETGDVKQSLPVIDQSSLLQRLTDSFDQGRGSIRVLVLSDEGRELAVDYRVVNGSRL
jgi:translation elongation factor P/translation initiation factor 5A